MSARRVLSWRKSVSWSLVQSFYHWLRTFASDFDPAKMTHIWNWQPEIAQPYIWELGKNQDNVEDGCHMLVHSADPELLGSSLTSFLSSSVSSHTLTAPSVLSNGLFSSANQQTNGLFYNQANLVPCGLLC